MIEEQFISFETAKLARAKGFDWLCKKLYTMWNGEGALRDCHYATTRNSDLDYGGVAAACTQSLLTKWLRDEHKLEVLVYGTSYGYVYEISKTDGTHIAWADDKGPNAGGAWDNFESALEAGLLDTLNHVSHGG